MDTSYEMVREFGPPTAYEEIVSFSSTCCGSKLSLKERATIERFIMQQVARTAAFYFKDEVFM